ncbi:MAG: hypothetical protein KAU89_02100 [Candidatus Thorarchaeota archaeon]|nr:hypothetical protein [Candidatus Thorarchaeota archaeon]
MNPEDLRGALDSNPYTWQERKGEVRISWKGKIATVLRKDRALKFLEKMSIASEKEAQLIMAKITGNFKRGNERGPR